MGKKIPMWQCLLVIVVMLLLLVWEIIVAGDEEGHQAKRQYGLSDRESEIACLIYKGKNNNDIASDLFVSPNTVKVHTSNLYRKLGVKNRVQAVQVLRGEILEEPAEKEL